MDKLEIEEQADWLKQIKLTSLSNRALTLASKLSHAIRRHNGHAVRLQDEAIALNLAVQVMAIDTEELNNLFRLFLEEALRIDDSAYASSNKNIKRTEGTYRGIKIEG